MSFGPAQGYHQEYEPDPEGRRPLYVFCRQCRKGFKVTVPTIPTTRVRCVCGHANVLARFDVFSSKDAAREFARFYTRIVRQIKDVLRANDVPVPDSQRLPAQGFEVEEEEGSPHGDEAQELAKLVHQSRTLIAKHEALTRLIDLSFRCRRLDEAARLQCLEACRQDLELVPDLVLEGKRRRREGNPVKLSFKCYKLYSVLLEEQGDLEEALEVSRQARKIGLKGYDGRIAELEARLAGNRE